MKLLTLDIETTALIDFDQPSPWGAEVSCCCCVASWRPAPVVYTEGNLHKLPGLMADADVICTYNGERFDLPILRSHVELPEVEHVDLMLLLKDALGWRPKLEYVARGTLGQGKGGHGAQAPDLYQQQQWGSLISYCLQDTMLTHQLCLFAQQHGYLVVWNERQGCNEVAELHQVGRRPAKGWSPGFWHTAMGVR